MISPVGLGAVVGTRVDSRLLVVQSATSDIYSQVLGLSDAVSDLNSDLRSLLVTTGTQLNASSMSDLRSAIAGATVILTASDFSDMASAVWAHAIGTQVNSRLLVGQSFLSDIRSAVATTPSAVWATALATKLVQLNPSDLSDIRSAITGVTVAVSASDMSDIASRVWATVIGTRVDSRLLLVLSQVSDLTSATTLTSIATCAVWSQRLASN